eukprot:GEMP01046586.1.p1 GENE.GEMP01046586.1~~GEMP01046586.1.p1  ORF type:complete len:193 (+),score=42.52 GEMP01046586.1:140-718(+)
MGCAISKSRPRSPPSFPRNATAPRTHVRGPLTLPATLASSSALLTALESRTGAPRTKHRKTWRQRASSAISHRRGVMSRRGSLGSRRSSVASSVCGSFQSTVPRIVRPQEPRSRLHAESRSVAARIVDSFTSRVPSLDDPVEWGNLEVMTVPSQEGEYAREDNTRSQRGKGRSFTGLYLRQRFAPRALCCFT